MGDLLNRALTPESINLAWRRLRKEHTVWLPGLTRSDMDRDLAYHLLSLADELRAGRYRPAPIRQFTISKADGRKRILTALSLRDKLAQRIVLQVLEPIGEALFHNDSFGYRRGRNTEMACRRAAERIQCGLGWLVDADIRSFFDEIPHRPLIKALKRIIPDRDLMQLLAAWLAENCSHAGILGNRRGIAQGAVLSPFFCNVYLHAFDSALAGSNIPFVRFADDFLLFAPTEAKAGAARDFARAQLERLNLQLHPEKTRIVTSGPEVVFLGHKLPKAPADAPPKVAARRRK